MYVIPIYEYILKMIDSLLNDSCTELHTLAPPPSLELSRVDMRRGYEWTRPRSLFAPITRPDWRPSLLTFPTLLTNHSINQTQVLAHRLPHRHRFLWPSLLSFYSQQPFHPFPAVRPLLPLVESEMKTSCDWLNRRDKKQIAMVLATHDRWEWKGEEGLIDKTSGNSSPFFEPYYCAQQQRVWVSCTLGWSFRILKVSPLPSLVKDWFITKCQRLIVLSSLAPVSPRGGRCSLFLTMRCFNDAMIPNS